MDHNPFEAPQTESKRPPSRSAQHMRATVVLFVLVLLSIVISLLVFA
jgi:hypothetical protein